MKIIIFYVIYIHTHKDALQRMDTREWAVSEVDEIHSADAMTVDSDSSETCCYPSTRVLTG